MVLSGYCDMVEKQEIKLLPSSKLINKIPKLQVFASKLLLKLGNQPFHAIFSQWLPVKFLGKKTQNTKKNSDDPVSLKIL